MNLYQQSGSSNLKKSWNLFSRTRVKMPCLLLIVSQSDHLIQFVDTKPYSKWQTVHIQIRSELIWVYTVCKGRAYLGSAGLEFRSRISWNMPEKKIQKSQNYQTQYLSLLPRHEWSSNFQKAKQKCLAKSFGFNGCIDQRFSLINFGLHLLLSQPIRLHISEEILRQIYCYS